MTFLDAARKILEEAAEPLHFEEIARRASAQGLVKSAGITPEATMGSRLYTATKQEGSLFVRVDKGTFDLARRSPRGIDAQVEEINRTTRERLRELLLSIPPKAFEGLILDLLLEMGFDEASLQVTPYVRDGGIDVVGVYRAAGLTEVNAAVQVKRWKANVQAPTVTGVRGSLTVHQQGIIITTSGFSSGARKEAEAVGKSRIGLIDGELLVDLLIRHHVGVTDKQLKVVVLDEDRWAGLLGTPDALPAPGTSSAPSTPPVPAEPIAPTTEIGHPKPVAVTLLGRRYAVTTWKAVLVTVAEVLAARMGASFSEKALAIHGRKRFLFRPSPDDMIAPARVAATGLWIEANQSAVSVRRAAVQMLAAFDVPPDELRIEEG